MSWLGSFHGYLVEILVLSHVKKKKKKKALDLVKFCDTHGNKREKGKERLGKTIGLADKTCLVFCISSVFINFFFAWFFQIICDSHKRNGQVIDIVLFQVMVLEA